VTTVHEHGDINRPIVIGALWSKKQEPVEVNQSSKNNTKIIKSRCGHRIIFDDKEGAEKIGYSFASFITAARVSESNRKPKDSSRSSTGETRARWPADLLSGGRPESR
jgi:uncharacterized protein involved in type VI secretion and phage assembly